MRVYLHGRSVATVLVADNNSLNVYISLWLLFEINVYIKAIVTHGYSDQPSVRVQYIQIIPL